MVAPGNQFLAAEELDGMPAGRLAVTAFAVVPHRTPRAGKASLRSQTS